jgi:hypothetical protein
LTKKALRGFDSALLNAACQSFFIATSGYIGTSNWRYKAGFTALRNMGQLVGQQSKCFWRCIIGVTSSKQNIFANRGGIGTKLRGCFRSCSIAKNPYIRRINANDWAQKAPGWF